MTSPISGKGWGKSFFKMKYGKLLITWRNIMNTISDRYIAVFQYVGTEPEVEVMHAPASIKNEADALVWANKFVENQNKECEANCWDKIELLAVRLPLERSI
jgi:hypothetical protein